MILSTDKRILGITDKGFFYESNYKGEMLLCGPDTPILATAMIQQQAEKHARNVIALKEKIIRELIPKDVSDEDGAKVLVENGLRFCTYPDTPTGVTHVWYCGSHIGDIVETINETEFKVAYVDGGRND